MIAHMEVDRKCEVFVLHVITSKPPQLKALKNLVEKYVSASSGQPSSVTGLTRLSQKEKERRTRSGMDERQTSAQQHELLLTKADQL